MGEIQDGATETARQPVLAEHGRSEFTIVIAASASPPVRYAAEELQRWLAEITGASLPIATDAAPAPERALLVGASRATAALGVETGKLGAEQYLLRTVGTRLLIAGGEPRGTLYGVYGLCQDHFGCRWFTPAVRRIPKAERLALPVLDETQAPAFEYRDVLIHDCHDADWAARNRLVSTHAGLDARHGGGKVYCGFVHTFAELLPPARHFAAHPEYYSQVDGVRTADAQLCCTNDDVVRLVTEGVRQRLRDHAEAQIVSVSQNDCFGSCQCARCQQLSADEGSPMAPVLQLCNRVADAIAVEFPDRLIDTLAYQWSRHPPKTLRPRPNVIVRLCSIECCFAHPFEGCGLQANRDFVADLRAWAKVCDRLWVWDYTTDFAHYLLPFPNLDSLAPNVRLLAENHVTGIFAEGDYSSPHGEFQDLRGYVLARCLWDPRTDGRRARDEFLDGVYGPAAPPIRRCLDALHAKIGDAHVGIYQGVEAPWLDAAWQLDADRAFDEAERLAGDDAALLARVRAARLSADYPAIERARMAKQRGAPGLDVRVERFFANARAAGLTALRENGADLAGYERELRALDAPAGK
ncbi:MAG TPA: DUF4838 domain-containing protein [Planctomycetota bacterium]|nr:DUF4838 domain-containing protein [Planctomycetota bacterium]